MKPENPKEIYLEPNVYPSNMERQWCEDDVFSEHDYEGLAPVRYVIADDNRLSDNFETALAALIEQHGADALTSLAAVMRHYNIKIDSNGCGAVRQGADATHHLFIWEGDEVLEHKWCKEKDIVEITANDIKPEK